MGQSVMYGYVMFAGSGTVLSTWWICVVGQIGFGTSKVVFIKLSFVFYIYNLADVWLHFWGNFKLGHPCDCSIYWFYNIYIIYIFGVPYCYGRGFELKWVGPRWTFSICFDGVGRPTLDVLNIWLLATVFGGSLKNGQLGPTANWVYEDFGGPFGFHGYIFYWV